jgi:hypothetical protein
VGRWAEVDSRSLLCSHFGVYLHLECNQVSSPLIFK